MAQSRSSSSSSSIKKARSSPSSASHGDDEHRVVFCDCGVQAPLRTSWTTMHPGMRFNGCPNYGEPGKGCGFLYWLDVFPERAKNVINKFRKDVGILDAKLSALTEENLKLKKLIKEKTSEIEYLEILLCEREEEKSKMMQTIESGKKRERCLKFFIAIVIVVVISMIVFANNVAVEPLMLMP